MQFSFEKGSVEPLSSLEGDHGGVDKYGMVESFASGGEKTSDLFSVDQSVCL